MLRDLRVFLKTEIARGKKNKFLKIKNSIAKLKKKKKSIV